MAQINKPNLHFNTVLYTGNGSTQSVTGVGFQPDWVWVKERTSTSSHQVADAVRGYNKRVQVNSTAEEQVDSSPYNDFKSFDSDGFSIGTGGGVNENSQTYAAWNWKANGAGSANTDGDINSTVSANTTSGVSIITYSGNGSGSQSIGHGLGTKPKVLIVKCRTGGAESWVWWQDTSGNGTADQRLLLSGTQANYGNNLATFQNTTFTTPSTNDTAWNGGSGTYVAYAFAEKKGFSKFGKYDATGTSSDGPFIYTGFPPAFVIIKRFNSTENWYIFNDKLDSINPSESVLYPNLNNSTGSLSGGIDLLSNGFKIRSNNSAVGAGDNYVFLAFAAQPLVGTNDIPTTAR